MAGGRMLDPPFQPAVERLAKLDQRVAPPRVADTVDEKDANPKRFPRAGADGVTATRRDCLPGTPMRAHAITLLSAGGSKHINADAGQLPSNGSLHPGRERPTDKPRLLP
jgi:hypothetical protein